MPDDGWNQWAEEITRVVEGIDEKTRQAHADIVDLKQDIVNIKVLLAEKTIARWNLVLYAGLFGGFGGIIGSAVVLWISR